MLSSFHAAIFHQNMTVSQQKAPIIKNQQLGVLKTSSKALAYQCFPPEHQIKIRKRKNKYPLKSQRPTVSLGYGKLDWIFWINKKKKKKLLKSIRSIMSLPKPLIRGDYSTVRYFLLGVFWQTRGISRIVQDSRASQMTTLPGFEKMAWICWPNRRE